MKKLTYINKTYKVCFALFLALSISSCESLLEEEVYDALTPNNFYKTEADIEAGLISAYASLKAGGWSLFSPAGNSANFYVTEQSTDIFFLNEKWGGTNPSTPQGQLYHFLVNSGNSWISSNYNSAYRAVAAANVLIDNIPSSEVDEAVKNKAIAEAKSLRALVYSHILNNWGNAPLVSEFKVTPGAYPEQVTPEKLAEFIENDLLDAIPDLPDENYIGSAKYGRFSKGGAQAVLAKLYLNTKQWQKAADMCQSIINNSNYALHSDYMEIFSVNNHQQGPANENLVVLNMIAEVGLGNLFQVHAYGWTHKTEVGPILGWGGYFVHGDFYNSFDPDDVRREGLITSYETDWGVESYDDRAVPVKYAHDPNYAGSQYAGNDVPLIRLADIYLARAEALNEISGPNQESIDLINAVRERAFEPDRPVLLADFGSKEELRDHILAERGWELYIEGHRREDLIRHGKYISSAIQRGHDAKDFHKYLPFPIGELDANPNLVQNLGY
ncbi:MAG: RagB/SusD family nutrient uptake outer membrane protein [Cytophagales bacterium]|nr:RagB/SusD family nutrient uptake outer membrane protein [Cytophagales bacterium]